MQGAAKRAATALNIEVELKKNIMLLREENQELAKNLEMLKIQRDKAQVLVIELKEKLSTICNTNTQVQQEHEKNHNGLTIELDGTE